MPRRRTPLTKAHLTGAAAKHPERYNSRSEPASAGPVGDPPEWLTEEEVSAWHAFCAELPWLSASDRAALGVACVLRARMERREASTAAEFREFRMALTALGGTPTSRSNVAASGADQEDGVCEDALALKYFS
ncbi:MAG: hypothetical protein R3186_01100 [Ruegeria sp.]|nr:hypothetical protein [Ruegeria sp.]